MSSHIRNLQVIARHPLQRAHVGGFPRHAAAVDVQGSRIAAPQALPGYEQRVDPECPADDRAVAPHLMERRTPRREDQHHRITTELN